MSNLNRGIFSIEKKPSIGGQCFPETLATIVFNRWDKLVSGDYTPPPLPSKKILKSILEIAYITGGAPEEDRYPRFNIVATPLGNSEETGQLGKIWQFSKRRQFTVSDLRRLAPAADIKKSAIWVQWSKSKLYISGLIDLGTSWSRARIGLEYRYASPHCLLIQVERPGRMRVYQRSYHVATLSDGSIEGHEGFGFHLSLHEPTNCGIESIKSDLIRPKVEHPKEFLEFEFIALWNTFAAIANSVSQLKHGGAIIIVPSAKKSIDNLRIKYKQETQILRSSFIRFINERHILGDMIAKKENGESIPENSLSLADSACQKSFNDLVEATRFVAQLSGCDGAIVISDDLQLLGFGAEITAEMPNSTPIFEADSEYHEANRDYRQLNLEQFGMRHRSAVKLVSHETKYRVLVVSQDGPISAVWSEQKKVIVRRGVNLVNMNMPWA